LVLTPLFSDNRTFVPAGTVYVFPFGEFSTEPDVATGGAVAAGRAWAAARLKGAARTMPHISQAAR
jgi:hypothetical protein